MALAEHREWLAVVDDAAARQVLAAIASHSRSRSHTRELLVRAATDSGALDSALAMLIYSDMLAAGYRGPPDLFGAHSTASDRRVRGHQAGFSPGFRPRIPNPGAIPPSHLPLRAGLVLDPRTPTSGV